MKAKELFTGGAPPTRAWSMAIISMLNCEVTTHEAETMPCFQISMVSCHALRGWWVIYNNIPNKLNNTPPQPLGRHCQCLPITCPPSVAILYAIMHDTLATLPTAQMKPYYWHEPTKPHSTCTLASIGGVMQLTKSNWIIPDSFKNRKAKIILAVFKVMCLAILGSTNNKTNLWQYRLSLGIAIGIWKTCIGCRTGC